MAHTRRLMIRFDDSEEQQECEISQLTEEMTQLFQGAEHALRRITQSLPDPSPTRVEPLVRRNTQRAIASRLKDLSLRFRQDQRDYLHRLQVQKYGWQSFPEDPLTELPETWSQLETRQQRHIRLRDAEIQQIAKSAAALAVIFREVAELVIVQGTLVDRIDFNMDQVSSSCMDQLMTQFVC